jgi:dolichol-phosphate mannosyltransferase
MQRPLISVIAPCHNEEEVIAEFHDRLDKTLSSLPVRVEIIYVNDGSSDGTLEILKDICGRQDHVCVLSLSRCFGHQMALTAGLDHARGDAVVIIDSDLQDPPELIAAMVERWRHGAQVVYGKRRSRDGETHFKLRSAEAFYWLLNAISETYIPSNVGDFRLMDRAVVQALLAMPECHRMLRAMVSWVGFRQEPLFYQRDRRYAGVSKYSLAKMVRLALDGLLSVSTLPLRLVSILSLAVLGFSFLSGAIAAGRWLITGEWLPAGLSMLLTVSLFSGVQLFCFGVMGEYVARIYGEIKRRPLYFIAERHGQGAAGVPGAAEVPENAAALT